MLSLKKQSGFSLLEILVAVSILAVSMLVILDMHGNSMVLSGRTEDITVATMLARYKMHEIQLEFGKTLEKEGLPAENKSEEGSFEEPFEAYKWNYEIKKVELPTLPKPEGAEAEAGLDVMFKIFEIVSEQISESAREIHLEVIWDELGEEQKLTVSTHMVKL